MKRLNFKEKLLFTLGLQPIMTFVWVLNHRNSSIILEVLSSLLTILSCIMLLLISLEAFYPKSKKYQANKSGKDWAIITLFYLACFYIPTLTIWLL